MLTLLKIQLKFFPRFSQIAGFLGKEFQRNYIRKVFDLWRNYQSEVTGCKYYVVAGHQFFNQLKYLVSP